MKRRRDDKRDGLLVIHKGLKMNLTEARTIVEANLIILKKVRNPEQSFFIASQEILLNHIDKLEEENKILKANKLLKGIGGYDANRREIE